MGSESGIGKVELSRVHWTVPGGPPETPRSRWMLLSDGTRDRKAALQSPLAKSETKSFRARATGPIGHLVPSGT